VTRPTLIAAVLADPDAAWAILTADVRVMGPWARTKSASDRVSADYMDNGYECSHGSWAQIARSQKGGVSGWRVVVDGVRGEWFADRNVAEGACDEQLRKAGWLLASGEPT